MTTVRELHGTTVLVLPADGPPIAGEADALDLVAAASGSDAALVAVPVERFDERFFTLSTGVAGAVLQKLVQYRTRLAVVGDVAGHVERSSALRDLVRECNRGRDTWFVADLEELAGRLAR